MLAIDAKQSLDVATFGFHDVDERSNRTEPVDHSTISRSGPILIVERFIERGNRFWIHVDNIRPRSVMRAARFWNSLRTDPPTLRKHPSSPECRRIDAPKRTSNHHSPTKRA